MAISVFEIHHQNLHLLNNLDASVFDGPIVTTSLNEFVNDDRHHLFVALDNHADNKVVGMVSGVHYIHPDKPNQFWVNELGVADSYLRQGIATLLMEKLLAKAKQLGCKEAWLATEKENLVANDFYKSLDCEAEECIAYYFKVE